MSQGSISSGNTLMRFFKRVESKMDDSFDGVYLGKRQYEDQVGIEPEFSCKSLVIDTAMSRIDQVVSPFKMQEADVNFEEELEIGTSFDSFDMMDKYFGVDSAKVQVQILPKDFKWVDDDWNRGEFSLAELPSQFNDADDFHFSRFSDFIGRGEAGKVNYAAGTNTMGFHLMFGYKFLSAWDCKRLAWPGVGVVWGGDLEKLGAFDSPEFRRVLMKVPLFFSYLTSPAGLQKDVIDTIKDQYGIEKPLQPILNPDASFYWGLEGYDRFLATDNINMLHFHVVALYPSSIKSQRALYVMRYIRQCVPEVTVRALRSSNQLLYIFKEQFLFGCSWVTSHFQGIFQRFRDMGDLLGASNGMYSMCDVCRDTFVVDELKIGAQFGWDYSMLDSVSKTPEFLKAFKTKSDYEKFLEKKSADVGFCHLRLDDALMWTSKQFLAALISSGLSTAQAKDVLVATVMMFDQFLQTSNAAQVFKKINTWISSNVSWNAISRSTFKTVLAIGGEGGVGKSLLAQGLHRGLSMPFESLKFVGKNSIGRGNYGGVSLVRFYDEVQGDPVKCENIFARFVNFEMAEGRMYKSDCIRSAVQFNIAASASIVGLPTRSQWLAAEGLKASMDGEGDSAYQKYYSQAKRRFVFLHLDHENFLVPYMRFFKGRSWSRFDPFKELCDFSMPYRYVYLT